MLKEELIITNSKYDSLLKFQQILSNKINNLENILKQIQKLPSEDKKESKKTTNIDIIRNEKE